MSQKVQSDGNEAGVLWAVPVVFNGTVHVRVPRSVPDVRQLLLAESLALTDVVATKDNPDGPHDEACIAYAAAFELDEDTAGKDWDDVEVVDVTGVWKIRTPGAGAAAAPGGRNVITIKQVYDNYPASDRLPIEVTDAVTLQDIEAAAGDIGDTLFLFLCRELCSPQDVVSVGEAVKRLKRAMTDIASVCAGLRGDDESAIDVVCEKGLRRARIGMNRASAAEGRYAVFQHTFYLGRWYYDGYEHFTDLRKAIEFRDEWLKAE